MSKPKIKIRVFNTPELIQSKELYSLTYLIKENDNEFTWCIQECLWDYLHESCKTKSERDIVFDSLVSLDLEEYESMHNKNNPFYGKELQFQQYCRSKYKKLFDLIDKMLETFFAK